MARVDFVTYHPSFSRILGPNPSATILCESEEAEQPLFHEACVYIPATGNLWVTSNQFASEHHTETVAGSKNICISRIDVKGARNGADQTHDGPADVETLYELQHQIAMANGGVNASSSPGNKDILFCAQGTLTTPSGIVKMSTEPPFEVETVLDNIYGLPFNSVNDVVVSKDGAIWFTDPSYGFNQGFKEPPKLPCQVYRYEPKEKAVRAMADGFGRCNGLAFSPDEDVLYVTVVTPLLSCPFPWR